MRLGGGNHIALGGAHVHQQTVLVQVRRHGLETSGSLADRHSQQHQVCALYGLSHRVDSMVNHAAMKCFVTGGLRWTETHHLAHQLLRLQCQ